MREGRGGERGDDALARGCSEGHLRTRHARWDFEYPTAVDGLDFIQNMDNKFVELLAGASVASDEGTRCILKMDPTAQLRPTLAPSCGGRRRRRSCAVK